MRGNFLSSPPEDVKDGVEADAVVVERGLLAAVKAFAAAILGVNHETRNRRHSVLPLRDQPDARLVGEDVGLGQGVSVNE